jgi:hypothetical protein
VADGGEAEVVVAIANESEQTLAVVFGLHEGVPFEQVIADAATADADTAAPPDYWQESDVVAAFGKSLTRGAVVGRAELVTGTHAVVCVDEANQLTVVGDLEVVAAE